MSHFSLDVGYLHVPHPQFVFPWVSHVQRLPAETWGRWTWDNELSHILRMDMGYAGLPHPNLEVRYGINPFQRLGLSCAVRVEVALPMLNKGSKHMRDHCMSPNVASVAEGRATQAMQMSMIPVTLLRYIPVTLCCSSVTLHQ